MGAEVIQRLLAERDERLLEVLRQAASRLRSSQRACRSTWRQTVSAASQRMPPHGGWTCRRGHASLLRHLLDQKLATLAGKRSNSWSG